MWHDVEHCVSNDTLDYISAGVLRGLSSCRAKLYKVQHGKELVFRDTKQPEPANSSEWEGERS